MDLEDSVGVLKKIYGPILLVLGPLFLIVMSYGGIRARNTPDQPSIGQWIFIFIVGIGGTFQGVRYCRSELGWFQGSNSTEK
jgi:hypothetical protein